MSAEGEPQTKSRIFAYQMPDIRIFAGKQSPATRYDFQPLSIGFDIDDACIYVIGYDERDPKKINMELWNYLREKKDVARGHRFGYEKDGSREPARDTRHLAEQVENAKELVSRARSKAFYRRPFSRWSTKAWEAFAEAVEADSEYQVFLRAQQADIPVEQTIVPGVAEFVERAFALESELDGKYEEFASVNWDAVGHKVGAAYWRFNNFGDESGSFQGPLEFEQRLAGIFRKDE